jgi:hypothetical protein
MRAAIVIAALAIGAARAAADPTHVRARVINCTVSGSAVTLTFNRGMTAGVAVGWRGHLESSREVFTISSASDHSSVAKVKTMVDGCKAVDAVILEPPPTPPDPDTHANADRPTIPDEPGPAIVLAVEASGDGAELTINRGSNRGLWVGWGGHLVDAKGDVPNGAFTLSRVERRRSFASVALGAESLRKRDDLRAALDPPPLPVEAQILDVQVTDNKSVITISAGSNDGIDRTWTGHVLGKDDVPLEGGDFTLVRINRRESVAMVKLKPDVLKSYPKVIVDPPTPPTN